MPGCYPTAAQLALKPLIDADLLDLNQWAGDQRHQRRERWQDVRQRFQIVFVKLACNRNGVFTHRHQPEIAHTPRC
ncbi:hypothetical protein [Escherichia coli]|uniref:hypothetical protein n=1 Tax=Escherichia coli TaxID=562 RepID=UPI00373AF199